MRIYISSGADAVAEEIKAAGGEVHVYQCDLSKREEIYAAAELVKKVRFNLMGSVVRGAVQGGRVTGRCGKVRKGLDDQL